MSFLRYFIGVLFSFFLMQDALYAQDSATVKWETVSRKTGDKKFELIFSGKIKTNWHLYAKASQADEIAGVLISLNDSSVQQSNPQVITNYRNIDDQVFGKKMEVGSDSIRIVLPITFSNEVVSPVRVNVSYYTGYKDNFIPEEQKFYVELEGAVVKKTTNRILIPSIDINNPVDKSGVVSETKSQSLFAIFGLGFIGGLLALFLPCFFPMIPLTVSFLPREPFLKKPVSAMLSYMAFSSLPSMYSLPFLSILLKN
jgi:thiol:disulfide interchange protein